MLVEESLKKYWAGFVGVMVCLGAVYWQILAALFEQWSKDPNYSHGFFVPVIAGWFAYRQWGAIRRTVVDPSLTGIAVMFGAMVLLVLGFLSTEYLTMRVSLVAMLAGLILYLFGRSAFREMRLPVLYLLLMIPLPYILYDAAAFPLKLIVANASVNMLKLLGFSVVREGNIILFPTLILEVADACSGLRSLMTLVTLAVTCSFLMLRTPLMRVLLVVASVPIAVVTNMLRVIVTGILAETISPELAEGVFHEMAGLGVFIMALLLTGVLTLILRHLEVRNVA
ncbi:exosortase/archaeosortase family protein [Desulfovibrio subterraneus]|uniref:exosortase/archaeosortase family protein n=1 Tax=Desulfovibrio subterraneus TaxID=2718620 RepID=UPI0022B8FD7A|nr:exosortase/archaeosortase family protein [Desulfovibrio subterraneus]WBF67453.1 exosortase/archaeosortase family protein [Desulfovibrio subterraneus]